MITLGGSLFVRNAVKFDYCVAQAIVALSECCDKVAVLEVESEDQTFELVCDTAAALPNVTVHAGGPWDEGDSPPYLRLSRLANAAREMLDTDWHFMGQADEVLHESSFHWIRMAIEDAGPWDAHLCRRINLYGDFDHFVPAGRYAPCGSHIVRLGKQENPAYSDAESLKTKSRCDKYTKYIVIFHYGFVRERWKMVEKVINMTKWFNGAPDDRVVSMKERGVPFDASEIVPMSELKPLAAIGLGHPKFVTDWIQERAR